MPRIRDLKDQQLYRIDKNTTYGEMDALLTKTADLDIVEEQMLEIAGDLLENGILFEDFQSIH